jgi:hypothetical protein
MCAKITQKNNVKYRRRIKKGDSLEQQEKNTEKQEVKRIE